MSLLQYVETRQLSLIEHSWASLAVAVLRTYIDDGCEPVMDPDWFHTLCILSNINPANLREKIEFIYGPLGGCDG